MKLLFPANPMSLLTPLNKLSSSSEVWLEKVIKEVTADKVSSDNTILYKGKVNNTAVEALYDTGASLSVMSH